MTLVYLNDHR